MPNASKGPKMNNLLRPRHPPVLRWLALLAIFLGSCTLSGRSTGIQAWIDSPLDGLAIPPGTVLSLEGHAAADRGLNRIEFQINGEFLAAFDDPEMRNNLAHVSHLWLAEEPGVYIIYLIATGHDAFAVAMDHATVIVAESAAAITGIPLLTPTAPPIPVITVSPVSVTPTPTPTTVLPDMSPPPAPAPIAPCEGMLACMATVQLQWAAVTDPSGIVAYQVELERHNGGTEWTAAPGSPWSDVGGTSQSVPVECGYYYQWRVRAVDGAGNQGAYSPWSSFAVNLY
jgi:hypothetical protein